MTSRLERIVLTLVIIVGAGITAFNLLSLRRFEYIAFTATVAIVGAVLLRDSWRSRRAKRDDSK
jgi:hypothetical protein